MQLHIAASVQRVGIGPRGTVRHQSVFRGRRGTTLSSRLLEIVVKIQSEIGPKRLASALELGRLRESVCSPSGSAFHLFLISGFSRPR